MKIENEILREELRALMLSPYVALPEYSADPIAQSRVGRFLAKVSTQVDVRPMMTQR
jgi:hypothetical protein